MTPEPIWNISDKDFLLKVQLGLHELNFHKIADFTDESTSA